MRRSIHVNLTYTLDGVKMKEDYSSLLACAKRYQISIPTLHSIIDGHSRERTKSIFPKDIKFELVSVEGKINNDVKKWHCDLCEVIVNPNSKSNHLLSHKHRKKVQSDIKIE